MNIRSLVALTGALVSLTACDGLREALTAHVDVARVPNRTSCR